MELFTSAGIELPPTGGTARSSRGAPRLRVPLLNCKVLETARSLTAFQPSQDQAKAAADYARKAKSAKFPEMKETTVRPLFIQEMLQKVLGYHVFDPEAPFTLDQERAIRFGAVDVAIGRFSDPGVDDRIVAPFELKGPSFSDLDRIEGGRGRSPIQQAWDYAIDAPGSKWVLVSNCLEIRLYAFGRGRDAYELFDLTLLDDAEQLTRLWLVLGEPNLLGGATDKLLRDTDGAYKDLTEELYSQYRTLRERLMAFLTGSADGPKLSALDAIEAAQKILDRILFIAFAQRNGLLPDRLLEDAAKEQSKFLPQPVWANFLALFRAVDGGNDRLAIWADNGGLFARDAVVDSAVLPDELARDIAELGRWDYRREVPVTVLGHIFEQSITDIEKLKAESRGLPAPMVSKRKREGVVYTPDVITRFLVERTIGVTLDERREVLWRAQGMGADEGKAVPAAQEAGFWHAYLAELRALTIVDPACGSGAFLVAAFDELARRYSAAQGRLSDLGIELDFDIFDEIVTKNLFGVDLNPESVEITRLSLWLKTARRDHRLQNLETTIRCGNSLVDDPGLTDRPFVWTAAFPNVFASGGFDIVIGNPPYVRMELLKPVKPHLARHYAVAADRADLYAYFFEKGVSVSKPGGRLGFISSSTFFRTGSGEALRAFLVEGTTIETVVDFGDLQIFEGVTTYPAIVTLKKAATTEGGTVSFLLARDHLPVDLGRDFVRYAQPVASRRLGRDSWRFENEPLARLRDKIAAGRRTLSEVHGPPLRGIVTGLNDAFVIDRPIRDKLVAADANASKLLVPFLRGEDIKRWGVESEALFLINTPKGKVDIEAFPSVRDWLLPFRSSLEKRATRQNWWELQQSQLAYQAKFRTPCICYPHFQNRPIFSVKPSHSFINDKSYAIKTDKSSLLSLLNSNVAWFFLTAIAPAVRNQWYELRAHYVERLPIPSEDHDEELSALAVASSAATAERVAIISTVRHRILDFASAARGGLTKNLENWYALEFVAFRAAIKAAFNTEIPVRERSHWETYLAENATKVRELSDCVGAAERKIQAVVYGLFDLNDNEIALLEECISI